MTTAEIASLAIASGALFLSMTQWLQARRAGRIKLLLGEKETAGYEAMRIAHGSPRRVSSDFIHALLLVSLFERSDRARIQVYGALDRLRSRHQSLIVGALANLKSTAKRYRVATDQQRLEKRLAQLQSALPWITGATQLPPPRSSSTKVAE